MHKNSHIINAVPAPQALGSETRIAGGPATDASADFFQMWYEKCDGREYPERADIHPRDLPVPLDQIVLIRVDRQEDGTTEFYHAIQGNSIVKMVGKDMQGQWISDVDLPIEARQAWNQIHKMVSESGEPLFMISGFPNYTRLKGQCTCTMLPLGKDGSVTHVLGFIDTLPGTEPLKEQLGRFVQRIG